MDDTSEKLNIKTNITDLIITNALDLNQISKLIVF
jgi:hypothetical protein